MPPLDNSRRPCPVHERLSLYERDRLRGLGTCLATATGVVDQIVDRGFVVRESDPADQRLVLCRMADRGRELIEGFWQPAR